MSRGCLLACFLCLWAGSNLSASTNLEVATWYKNADAAYTLSTDDCKESQVLEIEPYLSQLGLKGTFFINASEEIWAWRKYKDYYVDMVNRGHELGSHTCKHQSIVVNDPENPTQCMGSLEELEQDCQQFNSYIKELTGYDTSTFCYPWGREDTASLEIITQHYLSARDVAGFREENGLFVPNAASPSDMYHLRCFIAAGTNIWWSADGDYNFTNYEIAKTLYNRYFDETIDAGGWGIEFLHGISAADAVNQQAYYEHLDRLAGLVEEGSIWNGTQGEVTRYIYSRDAASIDVLSNDTNSITLSVEDNLDDEVFNVPLTLLLEIPEEWTSEELVVCQGDEIRSARLFYEEDTPYASFEVFANNVSASLRFSSIPGDVNADGKVDGSDITILARNWQYGVGMANPDATRAMGDLNGDGKVDGSDVTILASNWQEGVDSTATAIPEPTSWLLLLTLMGSRLIGHRRSSRNGSYR